LAALQADATANTTDGKKNIYLVTADGNWYYWNGSSWTSGGVFQSTGIADRAITANKLDDNLHSALLSPYDLTNVIWENKFVSITTGQVAGDNTKRLLSSYIEVKGETLFSNSNAENYDFVIYKYNKADYSFIGDTGWITNSDYRLIGEYHIRIMLRKDNGSDIGLSEHTSIQLNDIVSATNKREIDTIKTNIDELLAKKYKKHSLSFDQADIISDWKVEKMAHTSTIYADKDGTMYAAYMGNNITANEHPDNTDIQINFLKFNIADPKDIQRWEAIKTGHAFTGFTQGSKPPYDPNMIIRDTAIKLYFSAYDDATGVNGNGSFLGTTTFDKTVDDFWNDFTACQINYTAGGVTTTVRFDTDGVQEAYTGLGYSLSSDLIDKTIMFTSQIIKNGDYWYASLGMYGSDFRGMVLRTLDGVTWEVYCIPDQNVGGNVMENCIEIVGTKLYYFTRTGYFCVYDMTSRTWLSYQALEDVVASKVNVFYFNSRLYIAYNKDVTLITDWGNVPRNTMTIKEVNLSDTTKMTDVLEVQLEGGICYYHFTKYKGSLYMTFTNDRRKFNLGQVNSNISFSPVVL